MGYRSVQRSRAQAGKLAEAMEVAREAHTIIMRHGCKSNRVFVVDVGGSSTGEIHAEFEFDSMEDWASWRSSTFSDPDMQALMARAADVFDMASTDVIAMSEWNLS